MTKHTKCAAVYTILKSVFCWSQMKLEMDQDSADPRPRPNLARFAKVKKNIYIHGPATGSRSTPELKGFFLDPCYPFHPSFINIGLVGSDYASVCI